MDAAGFERLYAALRSIAAPALAYKQRKSAEILLHHLQENVLGSLHDDIFPRLEQLKRSLQAALGRLETQREHAEAASWRIVAPAFPGLMEEPDGAILLGHLSRTVSAAWSQAAQAQWPDYELTAHVPAIEARIDVLDYQALYGWLKEAAAASLRRLSGEAVEQCRAALQALSESVARMESALRASEQQLLELKLALVG
jgi:hypothetical protein